MSSPLTTVEFDVTPSERALVNDWLKQFSAQLDPTSKTIYGNPPHEDPSVKKLHTVILPKEYRLNIPSKIADLIVKG
jgi:hypothetical protein